MKITRSALSFAITLLVAASLSAQSVVVQWNAIASTTIVTNAKEVSVASGVWFAYVHLAVFDAVNAIDHRFQPYLFTTNPSAGANQDAAAVAAAHRILVTYFPAQQPGLDAQFATSVAAISDTPANISAGLALGEASALALITARANDGLLANVPYTPPVGPGFWLPTPPAFGPPLTPWLSQMVPFTMSGAAQFFPDEGPPALDSQQWIDDYNQVKALGALNSTVRTPQQTEIALFWTEHTGQQYARAFRNLTTQKGLIPRKGSAPRTRHDSWPCCGQDMPMRASAAGMRSLALASGGLSLQSKREEATRLSWRIRIGCRSQRPPAILSIRPRTAASRARFLRFSRDTSELQTSHFPWTVWSLTRRTISPAPVT